MEMQIREEEKLINKFVIIFTECFFNCWNNSFLSKKRNFRESLKLLMKFHESRTRKSNIAYTDVHLIPYSIKKKLQN